MIFLRFCVKSDFNWPWARLKTDEIDCGRLQHRVWQPIRTFGFLTVRTDACHILVLLSPTKRLRAPGRSILRNIVLRQSHRCPYPDLQLARREAKKDVAQLGYKLLKEVTRVKDERSAINVWSGATSSVFFIDEVLVERDSIDAVKFPATAVHVEIFKQIGQKKTPIDHQACCKRVLQRQRVNQRRPLKQQRKIHCRSIEATGTYRTRFDRI